MTSHQRFQVNGNVSSADASTALNEYQNSKLNICFIGESRSGKSTLINSLRGLYPMDAGAASSAVNQCTMFPRPYPNPESPNILFWDAPGVNTNEFKMKNDIGVTYIDQIKNLSIRYKSEIGQELYNSIKQPIKYDCYIICYKDTIHANDLEIAEQIKQQGLNYYFVRTNIDQDLLNCQRTKQRILTEEDKEELFNQIRKNIVDQSQGLPNDRIFFVSALMDRVENIDNRGKYDFPKLQLSIITNLEENKRASFISSMHILNRNGIKMKCDMLRSRIEDVVKASQYGGAKIVPLSSSLTKNENIRVEVQFYIITLRLTHDSIKKYVNLSGVNYETIKRQVIQKNECLMKILDSKNFELNNIKEIAVCAAEEVFKAILIPFGKSIASEAGAYYSGVSTRNILTELLDKIENTLNEIDDYCRLNRDK